MKNVQSWVQFYLSEVTANSPPLLQNKQCTSIQIQDFIRLSISDKHSNQLSYILLPA